MCIVESWMENEISDDEMSIDGYNVVRADRNRHGGQARRQGGFEGVRSNPPFGPQKILYTLL